MDANWDDLRVFLTLARESTLSTAAKALGVSHPTVSRRVQALEQQIGARLFERLPDRFVPTSAGEELLADTEAMEKAALSISRRSAGLSDTVSGVVRLSSGEAMAALIARHLRWLRGRLSHIEFEVIESHMLANLSRREADLLIREQVPELAGIVARKLGRVAYAVYAAHDFPLGRNGALDGLPWIGFDDNHNYMPGQQWLHKRLGGARAVVRCNNWLVLHEAVRSGAGLAVLPCYLGDPDSALERVGGVLPEVFADQWLLANGRCWKAGRKLIAGSARLQSRSSLALPHRMRRHWSGALPAMRFPQFPQSHRQSRVGSASGEEEGFPQFAQAIRQSGRGGRPSAAVGGR